MTVQSVPQKILPNLQVVTITEKPEIDLGEGCRTAPTISQKWFYAVAQQYANDNDYLDDRYQHPQRP